jgi:hypothetical protein
MGWRGLRITWREVLGLLIGVAICYGLFSYAVLYAPQLREAASERTQDEGSRRGGETGQRTSTTPAASDEATKTVVVRVTGTTGNSFGINYGNLLSSQTDEGTLPADYKVQVRTDPSFGDYVTATAWKTTGDSRELKLQILDNGTVVGEGSTTKDYGAAGARWSPNQPPQPAETTTPAPQKKAVEGGGFQKKAVEGGGFQP